MKKTLISVAVLSLMATPLVITSAQAQTSSTSIYGTLDNGMRYSKNAGHDNLGNAKDGRLSNNSGGLSGSHLGFMGQEDLGQGTHTIFKLEAGINTNSGELNSSSDGKFYGKKSENKSMFGRQAYLGLSNQTFGSMTMGRQHTVSYDVIKNFDPSNNLNQHQTIHHLSGYSDSKNHHNRSDATIKYEYSFANVRTLASYKPGTQVGSISNGSEMAIGMQHQNKQWGIGASYTEIGIAKIVDTAPSHAQALGKTKIFNVAGEYKMHRLKLRTGISHSKLPEVKVGAIFKHPQLSIPHKDQIGSSIFVAAWGLQYELTPRVELSLAKYTKLTHQSSNDVLMDKDRRVVMSGLYKLSKRTDIYSIVDWHSNRAGVSETNRSKNQQSISAGLRHRF
jgi:predicted porin